jgi:hypothetical protein
MDMGMIFELLRPGVEHAEEADFSAEVLGVGGDSLEGLCAGVKQQIVKQFLVLQCQGGEFPRNGEDHVNVGCGQKFPASGFEPALPGMGLTLGAVSIAA